MTEFNGCMTERIGDASSGIHGTIKNLWEDFHVREIAPDGTVCQLTHLVSTADVIKARVEAVVVESGKEFLHGTDPFVLSAEQGSRLMSEGRLTPQDCRTLERFIQLITRYELARFKSEQDGETDAGEADVPAGEADVPAGEADVPAGEADVPAGESSQAQSLKAETVLDDAFDSPRPAVRRETKEEQEVAMWGMTTEAIRTSLAKAHCLLTGEVGTESMEKAPQMASNLKDMRRNLHRVLREVLPFLTTDTLTTAEAFEAQFGRSSELMSITETGGSEDEETREANALSRVHLNTELLTKFQRVKISPDMLAERISSDSLPRDLVVSKDDRFRFIRVQLRPACLAWLLGRSLTSARLTRVSWGSENRWPKNQPSYLCFNMYKANRDTAEAINKIAGAVGCKPKSFSFAGTKDKRGCTVQRVSAYKVSIQQITHSMTKKEWDRSIRLSNFEYKHERVKLGQLKGNLFKLVIRDIPETDKSLIANACEILSTRGFINYFGLQRFGTKFVKTHQVGYALIAKKFEKAVRLILGDLRELSEDATTAARKIQRIDEQKENCIQMVEEQPTSIKQEPSFTSMDADSSVSQSRKRQRPGELEFDEKNALHKYLFEGDIEGALECLLPWQHVERSLLGSLKKCPNGFIPALQQLPKNTLALYYHAAQSLVWNCVASERVRRFGTSRVIVGDIVRTKAPGAVSLEDDQQTADDDIEEDVDDVVACEELRNDENVKFGIQVIRTEEQAAEYNVWDIMLPLPGDEVEYPPNMREFYESTCKEQIGISLSEIKSDDVHRLCHLNGGYRNLLGRLENCEWRLVDSEDPRRPLLASDADRLLGKPVAGVDSFTAGLQPIECAIEIPGTSSTVPNGELTEIEGTNRTCLLLSCSLAKSCYLTAAIREVLCDESISGLSERPASFGTRCVAPDRRGAGRGRGVTRGRGRRGGREHQR